MKSLRSLSKCLIVIASLITFNTNNVFASNHNDVKSWEFTKEQISVLKKAKQKCSSKGTNGNLCAAIVWHESSAGKNKIGGDSAGNFHNLVSTVVNREKKWKNEKSPKHSGITNNKQIRNKLLSDIDFEVKHTIAQLNECKLHLEKINKFNNNNVLSCYNGGMKGHKIPAARTYAKNVLKKKEHLEKIGL